MDQPYPQIYWNPQGARKRGRPRKEIEARESVKFRER